MTSRSDVELPRRNQKRVVSLAVADLRKFWSGLDLSDPDAARNALMEFVPALTDKYGDIAATVASDWYEEIREAAGVASRLTPELAATARHEVVQNSVRYAAGGLFTDTPDSTLAIISGSVDRHVKASARNTIKTAGRRDGARFARVPTGQSTCAFCQMMSSRGFTYLSEESAHGSDKYHDFCDCQIVPDWSEDPSVDGYDPDAMYMKYVDARDASGDDLNDTKAILASMREMYGMK